MALNLRLDRWLRVPFAAAAANTGWAIAFGRANHLSISPNHPGQLSLISWAERELSTGKSAMMLCGWGKRKDDSLPPTRRICNRHCLSVCLSSCNFAQKLRHWFAGKVGNRTNDKVWWRSESRIRIRIATLVRRALAEVCTVPVLLVPLVDKRVGGR